MPKLKTSSSAKKRFRVTAKGRIKFKKAGLRHLLTGMSSKRGLHLSKPSFLNKTDQKIIKRLGIK